MVPTTYYLHTLLVWPFQVFEKYTKWFTAFHVLEFRRLGANMVVDLLRTEYSTIFGEYSRKSYSGQLEDQCGRGIKNICQLTGLNLPPD